MRQSQRDRMVRAMTDAVAAKRLRRHVGGRRARGAGVSRETFYQQFSGKLDCFMSAFEEAAASLIDRLEAAATAAPPGVPAGPDEQFARFERGLDAYIEALTTTDRAVARVFLVEVHAAGPTPCAAGPRSSRCSSTAWPSCSACAPTAAASPARCASRR